MYITDYFMDSVELLTRPEVIAGLILITVAIVMGIVLLLCRIKWPSCLWPSTPKLYEKLQEFGIESTTHRIRFADFHEILRPAPYIRKETIHDPTSSATAPRNLYDTGSDNQHTIINMTSPIVDFTSSSKTAEDLPDDLFMERRRFLTYLPVNQAEFLEKVKKSFTEKLRKICLQRLEETIRHSFSVNLFCSPEILVFTILIIVSVVGFIALLLSGSRRPSRLPRSMSPSTLKKGNLVSTENSLQEEV